MIWGELSVKVIHPDLLLPQLGQVKGPFSTCGQRQKDQQPKFQHDSKTGPGKDSQKLSSVLLL